MSLDIWLKEDIANIILAAERASASATAALGELADDAEKLQAYRQGYRDALSTLALPFGLAETPAQLRSGRTQPLVLPAKALRERRRI